MKNVTVLLATKLDQCIISFRHILCNQHNFVDSSDTFVGNNYTNCVSNKLKMKKKDQTAVKFIKPNLHILSILLTDLFM